MELTEIAYKLHDLLKESDEYKKLKEKEEIIKNDPLLSASFEKYKLLQEEFIHDESKLKELSDYKTYLFNQDLVKEYNLAYKEFLILLTNITNICFSGIIEESYRGVL